MKKRNNKIIVLIVVAVLFAVSLLIFILNYSKDNSSFSILEKKWINDNTRNGLYMIDMFNYIIDNKDSIMVVLASITAGADIMVAADYRSRNKNEIKKAKENGLNAKEFKLKNKDDLMFALFDTDYYNETRGVPLLQRLGEEKKNEKKVRGK
jgi:hypothetical protein